MADEHNPSSRSEKSSPPSDTSRDQESDNIQSLTDFFDQMDRAAFKRALANRDAEREELRDAAPPKRLRGR